jgi:hypothetical protein
MAEETVQMYQRIEAEQQRAAEMEKKYFDKGRLEAPELEPGTLVWALYAPEDGKLTPSWRGPWRVVKKVSERADTYEVHDLRELMPRLMHVTKLRTLNASLTPEQALIENAPTYNFIPKRITQHKGDWKADIGNLRLHVEWAGFDHDAKYDTWETFEAMYRTDTCQAYLKKHSLPATYAAARARAAPAAAVPAAGAGVHHDMPPLVPVAGAKGALYAQTKRELKKSPKAVSFSMPVVVESAQAQAVPVADDRGGRPRRAAQQGAGFYKV